MPNRTPGRPTLHLSADPYGHYRASYAESDTISEVLSRRGFFHDPKEESWLRTFRPPVTPAIIQSEIDWAIGQDFRVSVGDLAVFDRGWVATQRPDTLNNTTYRVEALSVEGLVDLRREDLLLWCSAMLETHPNQFEPDWLEEIRPDHWLRLAFLSYTAALGSVADHLRDRSKVRYL